MSLSKRAGSPFWHYRFIVGGVVYRRSTETESRRDAEAIERQARAEVEAAAPKKKGPAKDVALTFDHACARYWTEIGQFHKDSNTTSAALIWLAENLGGATFLAEISSSDVARLVAKRRGDFVVNVARDSKPKAKRKATKPPKRISPARVNRSCTEPLRKVLLRARDVWGQQTQSIPWKQHMLSEPKERVRELTDEEERRLFEALAPHWHPIVDFCLRTGAREAEAVNLTWPKIDFSRDSIRLFGKGSKERTIPMPDDVRDILLPLRQAEGRVFRYPNGRPITVWGFISAFRRARAAVASLVDFRVHDLRHTAATRLLRDCGNLKFVQKLLGHKDLSTTARYAHVFDDDLRAAMNKRGGRRPREPELRSV